MIMVPLLWLLEDIKVFASAFADNLAIIIFIFIIVCSCMNATLHVLHSRCRGGLTVNARKSGPIMFTTNVRWDSYRVGNPGTNSQVF